MEDLHMTSNGRIVLCVVRAFSEEDKSKATMCVIVARRHPTSYY
jgi:hypothetical protein